MRIVLTLIFWLAGSVAIFAQADSLLPLKNKTVAVYFSKKQFSFDNSFRIPLSQFILSDKGDDEDIEDIKTQTLISLGTLFSRQLQPAAEADSVYFLNEYPDRARAFISNYDSEERILNPPGEAFAGTDYILVVNPFVLSSYTTSAVYTRSNQLITAKVIVKTGRVRLDFYDPATGSLRFFTEACLDERNTPVPKVLFEFHMRSSRTGSFLGRLFSLAVFHLNYGLESNCDSPE
jgi:hypothetical protein